MKYNTLIVLFILIVCSGCKEDESLSQEKIAQMYVDILIAEQTFMFDADSLNMAVEQVYVKHGVTKDSYDSEIKNFESDEEKWNEFFNLAKNYLDSLKTLGSPPES